MAAKYHYRTRTIGVAARNPYRPRGQVRYGPWVTVASYDTFKEADAHRHRDIVGLKDRAVFYRGIRLTDTVGRRIRDDQGQALPWTQRPHSQGRRFRRGL